MSIVRLLCGVAVVLTLLACAGNPVATQSDQALIHQLLPADVILLGEQHDAPDHQRIHRVVVQVLSSQHALAALVLEMASQGQSTEQLDASASEQQVQAALQWSGERWPWPNYGPAVMAAVRAGVPVYGANLPRTSLAQAMANPQLDRLLNGPALKAQQQNVRLGHCSLLPESQITPMTRVQIARDVAMSETLVRATRPGQAVLLLTGSGHADRTLGVAQHLPTSFKVRSVLLHAEGAQAETKNPAQYDLFWPAKAAPVVDHCADYAASRSKPAIIDAR